jgi:hypothetical protein
MQFYHFRTIAGTKKLMQLNTPPHSIGKKGISELVAMASAKKFDTTNWDELKGIEYAMLSIATSNGYFLITSESLFYGKRYIAVSYEG